MRQFFLILMLIIFYTKSFSQSNNFTLSATLRVESLRYIKASCQVYVDNRQIKDIQFTTRPEFKIKEQKFFVREGEVRLKIQLSDPKYYFINWDTTRIVKSDQIYDISAKSQKYFMPDVNMQNDIEVLAKRLEFINFARLTEDNMVAAYQLYNSYINYVKDPETKFNLATEQFSIMRRSNTMHEKVISNSRYQFLREMAKVSSSLIEDFLYDSDHHRKLFNKFREDLGLIPRNESKVRKPTRGEIKRQIEILEQNLK